MAKEKVYFNRGIIERFKNTMHMVRFSQNHTSYIMMQFIERRGVNAGKRYNYTPDAPPITYEDIANIICLFRVKEKAKHSFVNLFKHYWKFYK